MTFNKAAAETEIANFLNSKLYPGKGYKEMPFAVIPSEGEPGVIAFERPEDSELKGVRLDELAAQVAVYTGTGVVNISTWTWDGVNPEEEVMIVAFDVPDLPEVYRNPDRKVSRNRILPVYPDTAPSRLDFAARDRAREIITARLAELKGMLGYLPEGDERTAAEREHFKLVDHGKSAVDRGFNEAIIALDFARAADMVAGDDDDFTASPAP